MKRPPEQHGFATNKVPKCNDYAPNNPLLKQGYTVLPIFGNEAVGELRRLFFETIKEFPELCGAPERVIAGGFAALGNPGSFHNGFVRFLRLAIYNKVVHSGVFIKILESHPQMKLEQIIDRMLMRLSNKSPSAEQWHRDVAVGTLPHDLIFGGWLNLNDECQILSCIPGTHEPNTAKKMGFSNNGGEGFAKLGPQDKELASKLRFHVQVPPGCLLIFDERLIHEVKPGKCKKTQVRLFFGWRLTTDTKCLMDRTLEFKQVKLAKGEQPYMDLDDCLDRQGVPPLKSWQMPSVLPGQYFSTALHLLEPSSQPFKDVCRSVYEAKTGKHANEKFNIVDGNKLSNTGMASLRHYGLPMYRPYSDCERNILKPQTQSSFTNKEFLKQIRHTAKVHLSSTAAAKCD